MKQNDNDNDDDQCVYEDDFVTVPTHPGWDNQSMTQTMGRYRQLCTSNWIKMMIIISVHDDYNENYYDDDNDGDERGHTTKSMGR